MDSIRAQVESFTVHLDVDKATHTRDGLAKGIFGALFEWSVAFINEQLRGSGGEAGSELPFIGLLDIFGFESFATNSFEQLLINFANEKLQATFNKHVFAAEQQLYAQEGIAWREVTWPDNSACLALIAQKAVTGGAGAGGFTGGASVNASATPPGLLHLVDEMCRLPKCTDLDLNARFHDTHATHPHFGRPEKRSMLNHAFKVRHYAGEVTYSVAGFLAKNNDTLSAELSKLCAASACSVLGAAFSAREEKRGGETAAREAAKTDTRLTARTPALNRSATTPSSAAPFSAAPPSATGGGVHLPTPLTDARHVNTPRATGEAGGEAGATPSVSKLSAWKGRSETSAALLTTPRGTTPRGVTPRGGAARGGGQRSFSSVGLTFIKQMNGMVADLDATRCNFVRCIKPSVGLTILEDGSRVFDNEYVLTQLRHTGLIQCCELLKHGYPTRIAYTEVAARYTPILPPQLLALPCLAESDRALTSALLYGFEVPSDLYQLGATRLFFRAGGVAVLDEIRSTSESNMASRAPVVIARVHRWVALRRWRLAIAHTRLGLRFVKWHRSIVATRSWLFAARVLRAYNRSFRRLYHKQLHPRKAVIIQAAARAMQPRRAFHAHLAIVHAERLERERAARETAAATRMQAAQRGLVQRMAYREAMGKKFD